LRCPTSCSRSIRNRKRLKRSSVNERSIAESEGRRAISRSLPVCTFLLMPGFTTIDESQKCTSAISTHGSTRQRSSSTNTSKRHSVKSMASTGGAKVSRTSGGAPQRWNPILKPFVEPYCYVTLVHLKDVFEKRWSFFSKLLPAGLDSDRKRFLSSLTRLNLIPNGVMRASKCVVPNQDDLRFLREFLDFA